MLHFVGVLLVVTLWTQMASVGIWVWFLAAYAALSILKIRTFLEHQAHEQARGRTVLIEDRGLLSLIFLNNNYHVVHHMYPRLSWYKLPKLFCANRERFLKVNDGYYYRSYREVFARYFWRAKDAVPHPLWRKP